MKPRERVLTALEHGQTDRVPRFEIWIDCLTTQPGPCDPADMYVNVGQDCIMLPGGAPPDSAAWRNGMDEFGRIWRDGMYVGGAVATTDDLRRFSPPLSNARACFDRHQARSIKRRHPHHCLIFGTHAGPLTAGYMAMGFERFFACLIDAPSFVHALFELRTEWCIALFREALRLGAEVLVLGDDAAHRDGAMISPAMWREFVLPCHRQIVQALEAPVIWHSDGNIRSLLPFAIEAGFVGVHGLEPAAGMDLASVRMEYGDRLTLVGNIDVCVLCGADLEAVRREVRRCLRPEGAERAQQSERAPGGGYMIATCNSIFKGMNPLAVSEMFRYEAELGG